MKYLNFFEYDGISSCFWLFMALMCLNGISKYMVWSGKRKKTASKLKNL